MQLAVEHIGLPVRDTVALNDWYLRVIAAEVLYTDNQTPPAFILRLSGNTIIEIYQANSSMPQTADNKLAGWQHLALRVDSIATAETKLERRGVVFTEPVRPAVGSGKVLFFSDLEGNLLHLAERPGGLMFNKQY